MLGPWISMPCPVPTGAARSGPCRLCIAASTCPGSWHMSGMHKSFCQRRVFLCCISPPVQHHRRVSCYTQAQFAPVRMKRGRKREKVKATSIFPKKIKRCSLVPASSSESRMKTRILREAGQTGAQWCAHPFQRHQGPVPVWVAEDLQEPFPMQRCANLSHLIPLNP